MDPKNENDDGKILEKFECPFTWDMDDIESKDNFQYHPNDDEEFIPLLKVMRNIMTVYVDTKEGKDAESILKILEKCDDDLKSLEER